MKLDYSYKGYYFNLDNIANEDIFSIIKNKIKPLSINHELFEEKKFCLHKQNFEKIEDIKNLTCPKDFILIPENLFDLLYNQINKNNEFIKRDYKFNILIGDNVLFINCSEFEEIIETIQKSCYYFD